MSGSGSPNHRPLRRIPGIKRRSGLEYTTATPLSTPLGKPSCTTPATWNLFVFLSRDALSPEQIPRLGAAITRPLDTILKNAPRYENSLKSSLSQDPWLPSFKEARQQGKVPEPLEHTVGGKDVSMEAEDTAEPQPGPRRTGRESQGLR